MAIKLSTLAKLAKNELCSGTAFFDFAEDRIAGIGS